MNWSILLILSIAFISHADCRKARITRGRNTTIQEFPFQASIQQNNNHFCGGTIISEKHILTACHCVLEDKPPFTHLGVLTGSSYRSSGTRHQIANITIHSDCRFLNSRHVNDIAVIELKDRIVFDASQQKINLPQRDIHIGQKVNLTGWGVSSEEPLVIPEVLQALEPEIVSKDYCEAKTPISVPIYSTQFCVKSKQDSGACELDSGGPLSANGEVVGIVSWGKNPGRFCAYSVPVVNTNVYKYKDFIESAMK